MNFINRSHIHDKVACPEVSAGFIYYGFQDFPIGLETDTLALRSALQDKTDDTSLQFRYKPDKLFVHPITGSLMCEIKSENKGYKNYAIEFLSYAIGTMYAKSNRLVYSFVEIINKKVSNIQCCWAEDIPVPTEIFVPQRWDAVEKEKFLLERFPDIKISRMPYNNGSGTPYFLVSKDTDILKDFSEFLTEIGGTKSINFNKPLPIIEQESDLTAGELATIRNSWIVRTQLQDR